LLPVFVIKESLDLDLIQELLRSYPKSSSRQLQWLKRILLLSKHLYLKALEVKEEHESIDVDD